MERTLLEVDMLDIAGPYIAAEALGLAAKVVHHGGAGNPFGIAGEILDLGGDGELAAGLLAFKKDGFDIGTASVDAGSIARGT